MARLIVADDQPGVRQLVSAVLSLEGHTVGEAADGEAADGDAAGALLTAEPPDVLLANCDMPGRTELDLVPAVRSDCALTACCVSFLPLPPTRLPARRSTAIDTEGTA